MMMLKDFLNISSYGVVEVEFPCAELNLAFVGWQQLYVGFSEIRMSLGWFANSLSELFVSCI